MFKKVMRNAANSANFAVANKEVHLIDILLIKTIVNRLIYIFFK